MAIVVEVDDGEMLVSEFVNKKIIDPLPGRNLEVVHGVVDYF